MSRLNKTMIVFLFAFLMVGIYMVGCDSSSVDSNKSNNTDLESSNPLLAPSSGALPQYKVGNDITQNIILEDSPLKSSILNSVLENNSLSSSVNNTASGKSWLEAQGYSYVESNSLIMTENEYDYYSNFNNKDVLKDNTNSKLTPDIKIAKDLIRADTITWMAFENPTHDPANHTAILTYWRDGAVQQTILMELDVSTAPPTSIREGRIIGGEYIPEDVGLDGWWACLGSSAGGAAVTCLLSNCLWGNCMALGLGGSVIGCGIAAIWNN